jgi:signal transduction histidine kinase
MQDEAQSIPGPHSPGRPLASAAISASSLGRSAGLLTMVLSLIGMALTPVLTERPHRTVSLGMTSAAVAIGFLAWKAPWDRWPPIATIVIPICALGFTAGGIVIGDRAESFAVFFVVIFAWIGIAYRPGTCLAVGPLGVLAYVLPVLARGDGARAAILAVYYIPAAVLTGEVLAWLAEQLRQSESRLLRLDQLKNEFIGMVAHDMRTPLVVIHGFAERIREARHEMSPADLEEYIRTIERNAARASEFVDNLLQFARIETDEFRQIVRPFDIGALAKRVAEDLATVQRGTRAVNVFVHDRIEDAMGDEDRNAQVLSNLVSNAIKFSPPTEPIDVDIEQQDGMIHVTVHDRGPGIAADDVEKLFAKFSTLESADDVKRAAGTGLGLYISKRIVEAQGGRIWVETDLGRGSTFHYTVPAAAERSVRPMSETGAA